MLMRPQDALTLCSVTCYLRFSQGRGQTSRYNKMKYKPAHDASPSMEPNTLIRGDSGFTYTPGAHPPLWNVSGSARALATRPDVGASVALAPDIRSATDPGSVPTARTPTRPRAHGTSATASSAMACIPRTRTRPVRALSLLGLRCTCLDREHLQWFNIQPNLEENFDNFMVQKLENCTVYCILVQNCGN